jgi:hypothetical protein
MELGSQRVHGCSWCVITRFSLKLAVFSAVSGFQVALGWPNLLFELTTLAALLCVVLALNNLERPLARTLNYWDEALCFWLISHFGKSLLGSW